MVDINLIMIINLCNMLLFRVFEFVSCELMMNFAGVMPLLVVSSEQIDGGTAVQLEVLSHIILRRLYSIELQTQPHLQLFSKTEGSIQLDAGSGGCGDISYDELYTEWMLIRTYNSCFRGK